MQHSRGGIGSHKHGVSGQIHRNFTGPTKGSRIKRTGETKKQRALGHNTHVNKYASNKQQPTKVSTKCPRCKGQLNLTEQNGKLSLICQSCKTDFYNLEPPAVGPVHTTNVDDVTLGKPVYETLSD